MLAISPELVIAEQLGVAALAGLAVGIEREWSGHAAARHPRFAGVRTFFLLGILGGTAGWLVTQSATGAAAVLLAGGAGLAIAAYVRAAQPGGESVDGTTEAAALLVLALGVLAGLGHLTIVAGTTAVVTLALGEKERVRRLIAHIGQAEMRAALQFAVLALVVLPLLPSRELPLLGGVRPRSLWAVVLLLTALNFAGYLARRSVNASHGFVATGALGGVVSSTAVTLAFSRRSRDDPALARPLALGVLAACTVLVPRVLILSAVVAAPVALALVPYLLPAFVVGAGVIALQLRHAPAGARPLPDAELVENPLGLLRAIGMAIAFQLAVWGVSVARTFFGAVGLRATGTILGLTNMDALTFALSRMYGYVTAATVAEAIAIGVLANTLLKLGMSLALGAPRFRRVAGTSLAALAAAVVAGMWIGRY